MMITRRFMDFGFMVMVVVVLLFLAGCSGALHSADRDYDQRQEIDTSGIPNTGKPVTISQMINNNFYLGELTSSNDGVQAPRNSTDADGAVGLNGSTPSLATSGASLAAEAVSAFRQSADQDQASQIDPQPPVSAPANKPEVVSPEQPQASDDYETRFHHTTTGSSDGGKSLVMCPGQIMQFENCSVGNVNIPLHGMDTGREIYWNMTQEPDGDIICTKNGKTFRYKADAMMVYGDC